MGEPGTQFPFWLEATMRSRGLSQAQLARNLGVAETQVSRWRRGMAVPTVHSLQRLAETLDVPRTSLEALAGYPVPGAVEDGGIMSGDAEREAERQAHLALLGRLLEERVPRVLWQTYVAGCAALAEALERSYEATLRQADNALQDRSGGAGSTGSERLGFRTPGPPGQA